MHELNLRIVWILVISIIVVILLLSVISGSPSYNYSSRSSGEYGFVDRIKSLRKKNEVQPTQRVIYGNPMKKQEYVPAGAIKVQPKTDRSKIYISSRN